MSASRFLLSNLLAFMLLLFAYFKMIDHYLIVDEGVPRFYPQLLLEGARDIRGKVVVEAGSSAVHSIDPLILAEYFKAPVLITAVNAGYPLGPKLYNLEHYMEQGDVLILPLEWNQYAYPQTYPEDYVAQLTGPNARMSHLYLNLPWWEKLRFVYTHLPFARVLDILVPSGDSAPEKTALDRMPFFKQRASSADRRAFGGDLRAGPEQPSAGMYDRRGGGALKRCDAYLFAQQALSGDDLSPAFVDSLTILQRMARRGVRVYFTWPAVVDHSTSTCYDNVDIGDVALDDYARGIRAAVADAGFEFIAAPANSHFDSSCFLNTYYHLTASCARQRSIRLVRRMKDAGVLPVNSSATPQELLDLTLSYMRRQQRRLSLGK